MALTEATDPKVALIAIADEIAREGAYAQHRIMSSADYLTRFRVAYQHLRGTVVDGHAIGQGTADAEKVFGKGSGS